MFADDTAQHNCFFANQTLSPEIVPLPFSIGVFEVFRIDSSLNIIELYIYIVQIGVRS